MDQTQSPERLMRQKAVPRSQKFCKDPGCLRPPPRSFTGLLKQHGFNYQLEGIPLCVDQRLFFYDRYDQNSGELLSKYSLSSSTKFFIYVGNLEHTERIDGSR